MQVQPFGATMPSVPIPPGIVYTAISLAIAEGTPPPPEKKVFENASVVEGALEGMPYSTGQATPVRCGGDPGAAAVVLAARVGIDEEVVEGEEELADVAADPHAAITSPVRSRAMGSKYLCRATFTPAIRTERTLAGSATLTQAINPD
ncbi:MAG: hypothetical protein M0000_13225 [Actinomycetota bacterium]|nr:hypothetical protein [Actinomycetota bacterium]